MKHIILCNLQNSGSSFLDPIFREYLAFVGYKVLDLEEVAPHDDSKLLGYLQKKKNANIQLDTYPRYKRSL